MSSTGSSMIAAFQIQIKRDKAQADMAVAAFKARQWAEIERFKAGLAHSAQRRMPFGRWLSTRGSWAVTILKSSDSNVSRSGQTNCSDGRYGSQMAKDIALTAAELAA